MTAAAGVEPAELPEVVLIDLSSLFWTAWHASADKELSAARDGTLASVRRAVGDPHGKLVAICTDEGRSFRKDLLPAYKANRPEKDHASLGELDRLKARLKADGFLLWGAPGFEADDVIATACRHARNHGHPVLVVSADKDLLQLSTDLFPVCRHLRTTAWTVVDYAGVHEKFGVRPDQLGDWLALKGDKSDNVAGCPGVGDVWATKLLTKFEDLDAVYAALEAGSDVATPAISKALREHKGAVMLARQVVALNVDAPIEFKDIYQERRPVSTSKPMSDDGGIISAGPGPAEDVPNESREGAAVDGNGPGQQIREPAVGPEPPPPTEIVQTRAMTVSGPFELQLQPMSFSIAEQLADRLMDSRLYTKFMSKEAILAAILRGREMGIPALTALDCFHVIDGKPSMLAHLIIARAEAHPDCEYFMLVESDNTKATYETKNRRHPRPVLHTFTVQDAVDAGFCKLAIEPRTAGPKEKDARGPWDKGRAAQLRKTAGVQLARIVYPSAALGLYSMSELGGDEERA